MYEDSVCKDCGSPSWMAYDEQNEGQIEARSDVTCDGCRALDAARGQDQKPGEKTYLHNHITDPE